MCVASSITMNLQAGNSAALVISSKIIRLMYKAVVRFEKCIESHMNNFKILSMLVFLSVLDATRATRGGKMSKLLHWIRLS